MLSLIYTLNFASLVAEQGHGPPIREADAFKQTDKNCAPKNTAKERPIVLVLVLQYCYSCRLGGSTRFAII